MGIFQSNNNSICIQDIKSTNKIKKDYFDLIAKQQRMAYKKNRQNTTNLYMSLIEKSFEEIPTHHQTFNFQLKKKRIKWTNYLIKYLKEQIDGKNNWANSILHFIQSEVFIFSYELKSSFFFSEFELNTKPKCFMSNCILESLTDSLGGSFISSNTDSLLPNDINIEYKAIRNRVKSYINIFKKHIFDPNHPINQIVTRFVEVISYEMQTKLEMVTKSIKMSSEIELSKVNNNTTTSAQNYIKIIQDFVIHIQAALKLFYIQTLNYDCMREEKDEFVNLICCLLFEVKNGQLYHDLFEYYKMSLKEKITEFDKKLKEMNQITLYELGMKEQFRLDDSTLKYMKFFITDKCLHLPNDADNTEIRNQCKQLEDKISQNQLNQSYLKKEKSKNNDSDKNDNNVDDEYDELIYSSNYNKQEQPKHELEFRIRLGSLNEDNLINVPTSQKSSSKMIINNSNGLHSTEPFHSAIELLKSIRNYTIPFQKMLIIANLSLEIIKCVNDYWEGMDKVIPPDLLNIDADELLTIFIYIIIKGNISEILIHQKFIADFTTAITKRTMIGYYFTTIESALIYLNTTKSKKNLCDKRRRSSVVPDRNSFSNEF